MTRRVADVLQEAREALRDSASESVRLDAELLLAHVLQVDRTAVLAHPGAPVGDGQHAAFRALIERRRQGEPVAYIRGIKEFYGLAFAVDERALIPRPETETLVDLALERVTHALTAAPRARDALPYAVWDVGTGSGAIIVALAVTLRRRGYASALRLLATDVSGDAVALAIENAVAHGVADLIEFQEADLLDARLTAEQRFDLVLGNVPYIPTGVVPELPVAASFEPHVALDGGQDGLDLIRRLLGGLPSVLAPSGAALLEIGSDQAERVLAESNRALPSWSSEIQPDLASWPRVLVLTRPHGDGAARAVE